MNDLILVLISFGISLALTIFYFILSYRMFKTDLEFMGAGVMPPISQFVLLFFGFWAILFLLIKAGVIFFNYIIWNLNK